MKIYSYKYVLPEKLYVYWIVSIASFVTLFLSNLFIIKIIIATITITIAYKIIPVFQSPFAKLAPANVDDTIDGILAIVDIITNLVAFIGSNPAI